MKTSHTRLITCSRSAYSMSFLLYTHTNTDKHIKILDNCQYNIQLKLWISAAELYWSPSSRNEWFNVKSKQTVWISNYGTL